MATASMVSPAMVLGGSNLTSALAVVPLTNVAVMLMVLAVAREAAPVSSFSVNVPMNMEWGKNDLPGRAEMMGGLVAGELGAMANLKWWRMKR